MLRVLSVRDYVIVEQVEFEAEAFLELPLPLVEKARRGNDQHPFRAASGHQLEEDQAGLDGLTQADIVGDEE